MFAIFFIVGLWIVLTIPAFFLAWPFFYMLHHHDVEHPLAFTLGGYGLGYGLWVLACYWSHWTSPVEFMTRGERSLILDSQITGYGHWVLWSEAWWAGMPFLLLAALWWFLLVRKS